MRSKAKRPQRVHAHGVSWRGRGESLVRVGATIAAVIAVSCRPTISGFSPDHGPPGTEVTVTGDRLVANNNPGGTSVTLGAVPQADRDATMVQVIFRVAPASVTGPIGIRTSRGSAVTRSVFEVVDDAADNTGAFTFGGTGTVEAARVDAVGGNQEVLIGMLRSRWSPNTGDFAFFQPSADAAFDRMNDFWTEATFGLATFQRTFLGAAVIELPKSKDHYYHQFEQRRINSRALPANVNVAADQPLTIKSNGQDVTVTIAAGNPTPAEIKTAVDNAIAAADPAQAAPTFVFNRVGNVFQLRTTLTGEAKATLELSGGAVPLLGFGTEALYNQDGTEAPIMMIGAPLDIATVTFPAAQTLTITTLGTPTNANFGAGNMTLAAIGAAIQAAFPGEAQQQPYTLEIIADPNDATRGMIAIRSRVDGAGGDHGYKLTVGGTAAPTLGFSFPTIIRRYEAETFKGHEAIDDGFTAFADGLPAGTDLNDVFGAARMFVGFMIDDDQLRAHHSWRTFDINGSNFQVNYFVARQSGNPGPVFAHETGHALRLPDLYRDRPEQLGTPPGQWDVMDCSFCDAHASGWLKAHHHRTDPGQWIDNGRVAVLGPPAGNATSTWEYILTPVESPWLGADPFTATHPGIPVVHAIELIPTDPADVFFIENRQKGIYAADHLGLAVDFSTAIPSEGVTMYQGRRSPISGGLATFLPINLLTPAANPLNAVNEVFDHAITNVNHINVRVLERIQHVDATAGPPSYSYRVRITWGPGSFYDLAVRPWNPPPWESPDIWVDNQAQNGWGVYTNHDEDGNPILNGDNVAVNQDNRLHARIHNLGDVPVTQDFQIIWRIAVPQVAGGEVVTELGRVTVTEDLAANSSVISPPFIWRPTSSNQQHVCIKVEIVTVFGELNGVSNNAAQENFTSWYAPGASPFEATQITVRTQNPFRDRDADIELQVMDVPRGWTATVEHGVFRLPPGGSRDQIITIHAYVGAHTRQIQAQGYIDSLVANVEARTPDGDTWVPFGGLTAVVHPVNDNSIIALQPPVTQATTVIVRGTLSSSGPLRPPLGGREVHVRLDASNTTTTWITIITDAQGRFQLAIPQHLLALNIQARAYTPGGRGFKPTQSNQITRNGTPSGPGIPGGGTGPGSGVLGALTADGRFTILATALLQTGLAAELSREPTGFTLFAPTDSAFAPLGTRLAELRADTAAMGRLLRAHVVRGTLTLFDLRHRKSLSRWDGGVLPVTVERGVVQVGPARLLRDQLQIPGGVAQPVNVLLTP